MTGAQDREQERDDEPRNRHEPSKACASALRARAPPRAPRVPATALLPPQIPRAAYKALVPSMSAALFVAEALVHDHEPLLQGPCRIRGLELPLSDTHRPQLSAILRVSACNGRGTYCSRCALGQMSHHAGIGHMHGILRT